MVKPKPITARTVRVDERDFLVLDAAATALGVGARSVYRYIHNGHLDAVRLEVTLVPLDDVNAALEQGQPCVTALKRPGWRSRGGASQVRAAS